MTLEEFRATVETAQAGALVWFPAVVRRDRAPRGNRVRIAPGLSGEVLAWEGGDKYAVRIETADAARWLARQDASP